MRHVRQAHESWLDHVGKGFWIAVGFTPVFIIMTTLATWLYIQFALDSLERDLIQHPPRFLSSLNSYPAYGFITPAAIEHPIKESELKPVAEIKETTMTKQQQQERECSLLLLKYQQTQDEAVKQKMYDICP